MTQNSQKQHFFLKTSVLFKTFLSITLNQVRTRTNTLIESLGHCYEDHNRQKPGHKWLQMAKFSIFFEQIIDIQFFFRKSHSILSRLGQICSMRALDIDTGVTPGQKQVKNSLRQLKLAFSLKNSVLSIIFLPISLYPVRTRSDILIECFEN